MQYSIVQYHAEHERYQCGYCKSSDTNYSHGMWAHSLTVSDYQDLIDRGWRRSGKYCYKPTMNVTCCPMYTIRCAALDFHPSKSQKKIIKKANKYLAQEGGVAGKDIENSKEIKASASDCGSEDDVGINDSSMAAAGISKKRAKVDIENISPHTHLPGNSKLSEGKRNETPSTEEVKAKPGLGPDPNRSPPKKKKEMRLQIKHEKLKSKGIDPQTVVKTKQKNKEKSIEDFINDLPIQFRDKLQLKLVRTNPPSQEWEETKKATHEVYKKYQMKIHRDTESKCSMKQFTGFLVDSPLQAEYPEDGPDCGFGSFHQQYWLDGNLIAVGVIDILPRCISSVYFFYDPNYSQWSLGSYGALREIAFTRKLHESSPDLKYYYMGFYIHWCPKMRYKGNYNPSFLLCPETYNWIPIEDARKKLEGSPYSRLDPDIDALDLNNCEEGDLGDVLLLIGNTIVPYKVLKTGDRSKNRRLKNIGDVDVDEANVLEYAQLTGKKCAHRILLVIEN